jgi:outer membrane usher protein
VTGSTTRPSHKGAEIQYKSPWAFLAAGADQFGHQSFGHLEARGALSYLGGGLFPSNTIDDSFAVVDANGAAGIRVLRENKEVGRTGPDGLLMVPELHSYDSNKIAIDPTDVSADADLDVATQYVRPQDRAGVVVRFMVKPSNGALLKLVLQDGQPVPLGSIAQLTSGAVFPIGYDGEAYVQGLQGNNKISVTLPNGRRCAAEFGFEARPGDIPSIGPVTCMKE